MSFPQEVLKKARNEYTNKKERFVAERERRFLQIFTALPKAKELSDMISRTSAKLAKAVMESDNIEKRVLEIKDFNNQKAQQLRSLLEDNGYSPDALNHSYYCPLCNDTAIFKGKTCKCLLDIQKKVMYERLGNSNDLEEFSFDDIKLSYYGNDKDFMEGTLRKCISYANSFSGNAKNMLFSGGVGLGKTHISKAIGKEVIDKGFDVFYIPFNTLSSRLESAKFGRSDGNYDQYLVAVLNCQLLILDDLGAEFSTTFTTSLLYEIINSRLLSKLPTIINTNLDYTSLSDKYGNRILSRLANCYSFILFKGEDIRMKKKFSLE